MKSSYRSAAALSVLLCFVATLANGQELLPTPRSDGVARDVAKDGADSGLHGTPITDEHPRAAGSRVPARPVPDYGTENRTTTDAYPVGPTRAGDPATGETSAKPDNAWRYKFHQNRWWYWMPSNRWMVWIDNGWVDYDTAKLQLPAQEVEQYTPAGRTVYIPRPSTRIYAGPRYYYDEFYRPYGGLDPYVEYPTPRYRSGVRINSEYGSGYGYGTSYYGSGYNGGITIGGRRFQIGIGF